MSVIDNTKIFLSGIYGDATVTVATKTTIKAGTVLGFNSTDKLVPFSTDLNTEDFIAEPTYILAQDLANDTDGNVDVAMARVFESGEVDGSLITFTKAADATDVQVLAAMKNNGFHLRNVQQMV